MTKLFDPHKVLRQISNTLLMEFFNRRNELHDVPWDKLSETQIEPIHEAWQELPNEERNEAQLIPQDVNELAEGRRINVLVQEIQWRAPQRLRELALRKGQMDKALWVHLHLPEVFEETAMFARADNLAGGRYWIKRNSLPAQQISVDTKVRVGLEKAPSEHYWPTEMRGKYCSVEHYRRVRAERQTAVLYPLPGGLACGSGR
jgi:hypothetical protein